MIAHHTTFGPLLELPTAYTSAKSIEEQLISLSQVIDEDILNRLAKSPFFFIICDETLYVSVIKEFVVLTKYLDQSTGMAITSYLSIDPVPDQAARTLPSEFWIRRT